MTLIELLVVIAILAVVGTMVIAGWWAATQSMAYSSTSAQARDDARFALDEMTREIRDAQLPMSSYIASAGLPSTTPAIVRARATWIALFSSFDVAGSIPVVSPRLVIYCLYPDGNLWRYADLNGDGVNNGVSATTPWAISINALTNGTTGPTDAIEAEASTWEGASLISGNVVNGQIPDQDVKGSQSTDLFGYSAYSDSGALEPQGEVLGDQNRSGIVAVQIHVLVDLNPGHTPVYMNLETSAQLRNGR